MRIDSVKGLPFAAAMCLALAACSGDAQGDRDDMSGAEADKTSVASKVDEAALPAAIQTEVTPFTKDAGALLAYLNSGDYKNFPVSDERHPSAGPHDEVRVFYNQIVADSLAAGNEEHPAGSMIVKEQFKAGDEEPYGWSVSIKTHETGMAGKGWYWVEYLDRNDVANVVPKDPLKDGNGASECAGCHTLGKDFVRSNFPK
jgi:hypothetical protein